jgi:proline racemase
MRTSRVLNAVEVHAEGEQGTVYIGGVFDLPGRTMADKLHHVNVVDDSLRRLLTQEPRGRAQCSSVLVFPPSDPDAADAALIILQADRAHAMSGSNTICAVTALLETGTLPMVEPETRIVIETAAGLVPVVARCENGKCLSVSLDFMPSFVEQLDVPVDVPGIGQVRVDVAYGGIYYVIVDAGQIGLHLVREQARALAEAGAAIYHAAEAQIAVRHPEIPAIDFLSYVMFTGDDDPAGGSLRNATVLTGRLDRSPCGSGSSARLACLAARGIATEGSAFTARSVIDSTFAVEHLGDATLAGRAAVRPRITGRGWIHGTRAVTLDPTDPYPTGYVLSDIWG